MTDRLRRFGTMRVLVVDDKPQNVALLTSILEREGLQHVVGVTDPRQVEAMLPVLWPDLVILDLRMPELDGHQVLAQVVRFAGGSYLPVLVLTADASKESRDRALAEGARDYLTKPLDLDEVTLRVANLLETRSLYATLRSDVDALTQPDSEDVVRRVTDVLHGRRLEPALQPVVDLATLVPVGQEALSRFTHQHQRGPAGWFDDAHAVGLGVDLERLAVEKAVEVMHHVPEPQFLAVNMSPASVLHLVDHPLTDVVAYDRLVIELTEHVPVEDYGALHRALDGIRQQGARLAADDLGAGYAGFRHLVALEPDIIKLDISLVRGIADNRSQRALASALQAFATDMGAIVIAEGIEDATELQVVADIGIPWGQGYHLGRPQKVSALVH